LLAAPELPGAVRLTITSGLLATLSALAIVIIGCAALHDTRTFHLMRRLLAPLLAIPHAALAIGLAFLIAPSGWIARLLSPWLTGWDLPPDLATLRDDYGLGLAAGLILKEVPYLLLVTIAAADQADARHSLTVARSLGYGPAAAWLKAVLPRIYPQIRLPIYAVLAFSLSVVDMAIILAPATPPPLAPLLLRWFNDPDLSRRFMAAAGATLQLLIVLGTILTWRLAELLIARVCRIWIAGGARGGAGPRSLAALAGGAILLVAGLAIAGLVIWSFADRWRFPDGLPSEWTLSTWHRHVRSMTWPAGTTILVGAASAAVALFLALGCLENEQRHGLHPSHRGLWLLYLPILAPQISFLFGLQVLLIAAGLDASWAGLVWSHLLFVLPYVFLSLADPMRALDERYARSALCLGASPNRVFWRIKLPMLRRPVLIAFALGFAVSVAQFLPTLFAGGGRFVTLTTEAVSLSAGADRRVMAVYGLAQAILPLLPFAAALAAPRWLKS
jgi:putative thiamine transport system permease protein